MGARFKGTFYSAYTSQKYDLTIIDQSGSFVLNEMVVKEKNSQRVLPSGASCLFVRD